LFFWCPSLGNCIVCFSLTYGFWLPLWIRKTSLTTDHKVFLIRWAIQTHVIFQFCCCHGLCPSYIPWDRRGHDRILVGFATICAISYNPTQGEVYSIQHYVIKFVSDLRQIGRFLWVLRFLPPIKLTAMI